jgi:hypothetical protein
MDARQRQRVTEGVEVFMLLAMDGRPRIPFPAPPAGHRWTLCEYPECRVLHLAPVQHPQALLTLRGCTQPQQQRQHSPTDGWGVSHSLLPVCLP